MEMGEHLSALRQEGELLADVASGLELTTPTPTAPGWTIRDLLRHVGDVHRWAAAHVAQGRGKPIGREELIEIVGPLPDDEALLDWYREGHAELVRTLSTADPDVACWSFLPAPSPLAFWARRQAHETAVHRADAQSPTGTISPLEPTFGADGVEELLFGFFAAPEEELGDEIRSLHLRAVDTGDEWVAKIGDGAAAARRGGGDGDCSVAATASDLDLLLWNRRTRQGLQVTGDPSVLDRWRDHATITWGRSRPD
jgi:uncharacterized protein (TIGR03083 family)